MQNPSNTCPQCKSPIPADAPGGLCPACILLGVAGPTNPSQTFAASAPTLAALPGFAGRFTREARASARHCNSRTITACCIAKLTGDGTDESHASHPGLTATGSTLGTAVPVAPETELAFDRQWAFTIIARTRSRRRRAARCRKIGALRRAETVAHRRVRRLSASTIPALRTLSKTECSAPAHV